MFVREKFRKKGERDSAWNKQSEGYMNPSLRVTHPDYGPMLAREGIQKRENVPGICCRAMLPFQHPTSPFSGPPLSVVVCHESGAAVRQVFIALNKCFPVDNARGAHGHTVVSIHTIVYHRQMGQDSAAWKTEAVMYTISSI
ncbi:hypothetical protein NPIL_508601 [Nephila pilipes]|uniref:Uncharacterized protein n=1 Tax=Nephila pilipes TaxID=299642 RepID=A0A8X6JC55_NEPPI|nr:hypothetical protein NPIL_508601 [Nephila pilipes]